jgi:GNAT superfamily N-acetyltransferase
MAGAAKASGGVEGPCQRPGHTALPPFEIRPAVASDRAALLALIGKMAFKNAEAHYEWLYRLNPHGRALTWLAVDVQRGEPLACTSLFPRKVLVNGQWQLGASAGDTFVEPFARRQGIALAMHRHVRGAMGERGIGFHYSAPVAANLAARLKAGSQVVSQVQCWVRPLTAKAIYGHLRYLPMTIGMGLAEALVRGLQRLTRISTGSLSLEPITTFGPEFEELFEETARSRPLICVRDCSYLAWRYLRAPRNCQRPFAVKQGGTTLGFMALEKYGEESAIVDLFTIPDPDILKATLQLTLDLSSKEGSSRLALRCTPGSFLVSALRRFLFLRRATGRSLQVTLAEKVPSQAGALLRSDVWHYLSADEDLETIFG